MLKDPNERLTVAVHLVIEKAMELNQPMDLMAKVLIDQGTKLLVKTQSREAAVIWLEATLDDVRSKGYETTGFGHA